MRRLTEKEWNDLWDRIISSTPGRLITAIFYVVVIYWLFTISIGGTSCPPSTGPIC